MDLEKYRENGRININKAKEEQVIKFSDTEQRGARKNKFWFNNHKMMYKDIYPETYEDYAELIGYEFAKLLGMNCASYDLAIYNGNFGVITKSIVNEDREAMVSGSEIISTVYTDYILILFYLLNEFKNLLKKYNIFVIPLHVNFDNESYLDGKEIQLEDLYKKVEEKKKLPTTSAASYGEIKDFFTKYLDEGYDIVYTGISSKMSATFNVACSVREDLDKERIFLVDSGNLSTGIGLVLLKAATFRDQGFSAKEIAEKLEEIVPRVKSQFVIDTLDYLYKGGRCSSVAYVFSKVLKVKPLIVVREKTMQVGAKFIGSITKAQKGMTNIFLKDFPNIDKEFVFITHTLSFDGANYIKSLISNVSGEIENLYETVAGLSLIHI